ncbi:MAG: L-seryl-tRNA(Sec) selenium transferase [Spirochaetaceae bacterium]|nr:L-seryl-tRNA(Sec) selenium transferase [Spirochaetaceae bacterium]
MYTGTKGLLRSLPAVGALMEESWAEGFCKQLGRETVKTIIVQTLNGYRDEFIKGGAAVPPEKSLIILGIKEALSKRAESSLKRVVNATGVVIHTNLGRAPLAGEAVRAAAQAGEAYSALEYSPQEGARTERNSHVEWAVCALTGAEAALVVNNNAAAVLLALSALAAGREVAVSCGELVEIGGSFRIPEILAFSGAKLIIAGCTNSTVIEDYRRVITENTAVLLKVHPSNYRMEGFVKETSRKELAALARECGLVFMEDLGSGLLCGLNLSFANREHPVSGSIKDGCDIVTFSGDKLAGGPQAGVIAGSKNLIDKLKKHQLLRALRVDKMTLAALEATLRLYLRGEQSKIPVIKMMEESPELLLKKARLLRRVLKNAAREHGAAPEGFKISVVETRDASGGGSYPTECLPGFGVEIRPAAAGGEEALARSFRLAPVPVITAVHDGAVVLHVRAMTAGDEKYAAAAFATALKRL